MKKVILAVAALGVVAAANADPGTFTNLGAIFDTTSNYPTPDAKITLNGFAAGEIKWFKFSFAGTNGTTNFLDIDTSSVNMGDVSTQTIDTEIGLYDAAGNMIANDDDDGAGFYSALTFGNAGPRSYTLGGGISQMTAANGRDGALAGGPAIYWLAVGKFNTTFGTTNWNVTSTATATTAQADLNFRTDAVPEPGTIAALGLGAAVLLRRKAKKA